jgi:hypothetical protein
VPQPPQPPQSINLDHGKKLRSMPKSSTTRRFASASHEWWCALHPNHIGSVNRQQRHMSVVRASMTPRKRMVRTSVILPEGIYAQVMDLAAGNDVSAAWAIRHALTEFLNTHSDQTALPLQLPKEKGTGRKSYA